MSPKTSKSALLAITSAAIFLSPCAVTGATKVVVDKPKFDTLQSPEFGAAKSKPFKPKEWLEVEAKIKVMMIPVPKSKTCDRLTIKWYLAVKNPEKTGTYYKLTKEVEHVNIALDEEVYCSVYLSPSAIKRLTGSERANKHLVKSVGMEILIDGQVVATETEGGKDKWWTSSDDKIAESTLVPLLSKAETPFALMWWDRFAEIKSKTSP